MAEARKAARVTAGYAYLWEFLVQPTRQADFERHYAPDGSWAALFRQAGGYIGTQLLRDRSNRLRYITIDRWTGIESYRVFRVKFAEQYEALDRQCAELSTHEAPLGEYDEDGTG
jgi:heme-degrading monooxygenase HmoA